MGIGGQNLIPEEREWVHGGDLYKIQEVNVLVASLLQDLTINPQLLLAVVMILSTDKFSMLP